MEDDIDMVIAMNNIEASKRDRETMTCEEKLEAIEALMNGEYNHPALEKLGELYANRVANIHAVLSFPRGD